jgi:hypothetical protein
MRRDAGGVTRFWLSRSPRIGVRARFQRPFSPRSRAGAAGLAAALHAERIRTFVEGLLLRWQKGAQEVVL